MSTFPSYIKQTVAYRSGQIPTADEINSYFNLLIEQGDLTTTVLVNHLAGEAQHITTEERTAWNEKEDKTVVAAINVRLNNLENALHDITVTRARIDDDLSSSATTYSSNKINNTFVLKTEISNEQIINIVGKTPLDAVQNNPDVPGSLRQNINNNTTDIVTLKKSYTKGSITITNAGWVADTTNGGVKKTMTIAGISATDIIDLYLTVASSSVAKDCGFSGTLESGAGTITFYADSIPSGSITGDYTVKKVVN